MEKTLKYKRSQLIRFFDYWVTIDNGLVYRVDENAIIDDRPFTEKAKSWLYNLLKSLKNI